jgi:hypothetical protein
MRFSFLTAFGFALLVLVSCGKKKVVPGTYTDLNTKKPVTIVVDPKTGYAINSKTKKPVYLYIDDKHDTILTDGRVVNGKLMLMPDGKYEANELEIKIDTAIARLKHRPHE